MTECSDSAGSAARALVAESASRSVKLEMDAEYEPTIPVVADFEMLPRDRLESMLEAGAEVLDCLRVLHKGGLNVVGECLRGQGKFLQYDHYPEGDVYDRESHSQYYYHSHPGRDAEHGHFHTFLRPKGMPPRVAPVTYTGEEEWPTGDDALSHLVAFSMNAYGLPIALFATNRWVTNEVWYPAADVIRMLDRYEIDHAYPSWPVNRWLTAMMRLFRTEIEALLWQRDAVVGAWAEQYPDKDVFEDRALDITGFVPVNIDESMQRIEAALSPSAEPAPAPETAPTPG